MLAVFGSINKGNGLLFGHIQNFFNELRFFIKLIAVFFPEFFKLFGIMIKPSAQFIRWGEVLQPFVQMQFYFADAPKPKPVNQHAKPIVLGTS
jgi:hypothetical protein